MATRKHSLLMQVLWVSILKLKYMLSLGSLAKFGISTSGKLCKFGTFWASLENLVSLASLASLTRVGEIIVHIKIAKLARLSRLGFKYFNTCQTHWTSKVPQNCKITLALPKLHEYFSKFGKYCESSHCLIKTRKGKT